VFIVSVSTPRTPLLRGFQPPEPPCFGVARARKLEFVEMVKIKSRYISKMQNGKVYKIVSSISENIYIGSTFQLLCQRLSRHKACYKRYLEHKSAVYLTSFELIKNDPNVSIILIEEYNCNDKKELHSRERFWIEQNKNIIVNKNIPTRTKQEYYIDNYEHLNEIKNKKFICNECNGYYTHTNRTHHFKTLKHSRKLMVSPISSP
jgi:predicted GIY-YIG superfamily endonuclease